MFQSMLLSLGESIHHDNALYISNCYIIIKFYVNLHRNTVFFIVLQEGDILICHLLVS